MLIDTNVEHSYFEPSLVYYKEAEGFALGASASSILSEIFIH
jgi:hypothetical protein